MIGEDAITSSFLYAHSDLSIASLQQMWEIHYI